MIRVVITGPPSGTGWIPYKVDWWAKGRSQFVGVSQFPLLDACRQLQQYGLMNDTVVGLFEADDPNWLQRTTVGFGARYRPPQTGAARPAMRYSEEEATMVAGKYREFPGGPLRDTEPEPTGGPPARPAEPPPAPRKPREPPADTGRGHAKPKHSGQSHHKPKRGGSSARRGSR